MNNVFNKIYDLTYLPLLTPSNLIESLKVDNFISINYSKNEIGIIADVRCFVDKKEMSFIYQFDQKDFLISIHYIEDGKIEYLFNRNLELKDLRKEYIKSKVL